MSTRGHRKSSEGKQTGSPTEAQKRGKGRKTLRTALTLLSLGAPLLLNAQEKDIAKAFPSQDGGKDKIALTTAGEKPLPKNTLVVPDTTQLQASTRAEAPVRASTLAPSPKVYGEKFCDVNVENDSVRIKVRIDDIVHYYDLGTVLFAKMGLPEASNKDIAAIAQDKTNSTIHFITRKGILSLTVDMTEIKNAKKIGAMIENNRFSAISSKDPNDFFTTDGSFYISPDGSRIFLASPTTFIVLKPEYKNCFPWSSFGKKLPLQGPTVDSEEYDGKAMVRIRDPTMKMNNGKNYKIFMDMETFEVGSFEY